LAGNIEGVVVKPLKLVPNERGRLMEVQRCDEADFPGFGQVYVTQTFAGVVKAWYRHRDQIDQIASISGLMKVALYDDREESSTRGVLQEIYIGELAPRLVRIPAGVWHGFKAVGESSAFLLHLNVEPYHPDAPDEDRLPSNDPSIPYVW
jgi:dTDP-4-dehydrorhamnose 3,5-epimerase